MLLLGFALLILGAELLVKGSSKIANKFNIPEILIGLTIVAIGTSLPELMITITSAQKGATDLIISNAVGSNLCNLLLIMGTLAIIRPVKLDKETRIVHIPVALISSLIILFIGVGAINKIPSVIQSGYGIFLVTLYILYFLYPISQEINDASKLLKENKKKHIKNKHVVISIVAIIAGAIFLKFGGDLVVDTSVEIAHKFGISEKMIGLTIVAVGTALPELITSIMAAISKDDGLAVGNLIGSCILNSFFIVGVGAIISPLEFSKSLIINMILVAFVIDLIWMFCFVGKKNTITRNQGLVLIGIYVCYLIGLITHSAML